MRLRATSARCLVLLSLLFLYFSSPSYSLTVDYAFRYELYTADILHKNRNEDNGRWNPKMAKALEQMLRGAQSSVHLAIYGIRNQRWLEDDLVALRQQNVNIQAVVDQENGAIGEWIPDNFMYPDTAHLPEIIGSENVIPDLTKKGSIRKSSIMHNKFIVVDDRFLWTGSTNLSEHGIGDETHANVSIKVESKELSTLFTAEFAQMFRARSFSLAKTRSSMEPIEFSDGTRATAFFSPQDRPIQTAILPFIGKTTRRLDIAMYFLTDPSVILALKNAVQRGVKVRLIYDKGAAHHPYNYVRDLIEAGVEVRVENWPGKMHKKTAVADGKNVVIGSMNWSKSGNQKNDENTLVIEGNPSLAQEMSYYFNTLWESLADAELSYGEQNLLSDDDADLSDEES